MSFTQVILEAEQSAKEAIDQAELKAHADIEQWKKANELHLNEFHSNLLDRRSKELKAQKESLVSTYKNILEEGKQLTSRIERQAVERKKQAIDMVMQQLRG